MNYICKIILTTLVFIAFSFSSEAQYRSYHVQETEGIYHDKYGDPIIKSNGFRPKESPPTEVKPFEFEINFGNFNELYRLEAARAAAAKREYARWLAKQQSVLLKEINKQLGTRHSNFKTARNDFFRDFEKNQKQVERAASTQSWKLSQKAKVLNEQQVDFTKELFLIKKWKKYKVWCESWGFRSDQCNQLSSTKVRGKTLGYTSTSTLNKLYTSSLNDFSSREFQSAQNLAWSTGVKKIINDHSLLNTMINNHIKYFDKIGNSEIQVYLMINYLSSYYSSQNPLVYQIKLPHPKYEIPTFWNEKTIVEIGKKRAPVPDIKALIFSPNYIQDTYNRCQNGRPTSPRGVSIGPDYCKPRRTELKQLREELIQDHLDNIEARPFFVADDLSSKVDPKTKTKCFDKTKPAKIIIYVEQPIPNSREITADIGHTFIGIEQGGITRYLGFYPDSPGATLVGDKSVDAEIHDNSGSPFDVSISTTVTSAQLTKVINLINNYPKIYNLEEYNCSDFGIQIGKEAGLSLPATIGKYSNILFKFEGRNPADLGEDIRKVKQTGNIKINNKSGNAPKEKGGC